MQLVSPDAPLREKLAQLMWVRMGSNLPPVRTVEEDEERIAKLLAEVSLGGLIIFNGNFVETPKTLERLQASCRIPLLIGADFERGVGQQLKGYPLVPHAMAFAALGDRARATVRRFAELTGAAARAAGVHVLFGPVADVNSDPHNPIIATRAFSADPVLSAELTAAYVAGCRAGGALATAKHFPGHGDTHEDSHHALPTVGQARATLDVRELVPFREAISAGTPLIMSAHVRYPSLDSSEDPATLSRAILTNLLRDELGFAGVVISDSLLMEGVKVGCGNETELAIRALHAGVDILLDVSDPAQTLDGLEAAAADGALDLARVDEALVRVNRLKLLAASPGPMAWNEADNRRETEEMARQVALQAARIDDRQIAGLVFSPQKSLGVLFINPFQQPQPGSPQPLGKALSAKFAQLDYEEFGPDCTVEALAAAAQRMESCAGLLVAMVVKPAAWHRFGLRAELADWIQTLLARRQTVVACLGAPQGLEPYAGAAARVCMLSDVPASQLALAEALTTGGEA